MVNGFLFRIARIENNLNTQNSGVVVRGDDSTGNIDWFGVIRKIVALEFGLDKEVVLFECDWYDIPPANRNQGRGFKKDKFGIIDIDTTRFRYKDEPYILSIQAEQVFYVKDVNKPNWSTVVRVKPRNLFAMPQAEMEADIDSINVGVEEMNIPRTNEDITNWSRIDMEGVSGDASVIEKAHAAQSTYEDGDSEEDEEEDDTYIDDGHVAPTHLVDQDSDDEFFV